jgi:TatD DNase family protein
MIVDIHTHRASVSEFPAIRNLPFSEAERIFSTDEKGLFSLGFHPWSADEFTEELSAKLEKWANDKRLVAIGECGLDKNSKTDIKEQIEVFKRQILLSEQVQKPLIIHCVGCFNELFEVKKQLNPQQLWIIHGFRGKPELAQQALNIGCNLSFGEYFNTETVLITPIENLFLETDESTLSIKDIYQKIADIKQVSPTKLIAANFLFQQHL